MSIVPSAVDPHRKEELQRMKNTANSEYGKEMMKQNYNIKLGEGVKLNGDTAVPDISTKPKTVAELEGELEALKKEEAAKKKAEEEAKKLKAKKLKAGSAT